MTTLHFLNLCKEDGCLNPASPLSTPYCPEHSPAHEPMRFCCKMCGSLTPTRFCSPACETAYDRFFEVEEAYE